MHSSFFNICYIKFCLRGYTTPANVRGHKQILVRPSPTKYECTFVFFLLYFFLFSFIFFLFFFYFFSFSFFLLYLFHFITRQIWRCGQPKADFTSANTRFRLVQHHQQTFFYYLSYRRKHFCTFQKTNWNLYFFYLPEKTFLRFPVKIHQKSNLRIRAN